MTDVSANRRGVVSGMLNLARNLGLITGASVMGAVFALASGAGDFTTARPGAVAFGMRITFAVAAALLVVALVIAITASVRASRARMFRRQLPTPQDPISPAVGLARSWTDFRKPLR